MELPQLPDYANIENLKTTALIIGIIAGTMFIIPPMIRALE